MTAYVRKAGLAAGRYGISLIKRQDGDPQDLLESLASIKGQVDALWVLPDSAVVTAGTVDMLFKFASGTNIPAIVFSKNYLKAGAAVALESERTMMGKQAGELVADLWAATILNQPRINRVSCFRFGSIRSYFKGRESSPPKSLRRVP